MKKRLISLVLALTIMLLILPVGVYAAESPVASNNIDDHYYANAGRYSRPVKSTLAREGDNYVRVEHVGNDLVVEYYDSSFEFISGRTIPLELPIYGGVYLCDDYNFVVVGQNNLEENDEIEVFRIIRYSKDWIRQDSAGLFGANTIIPFDAGSLRFDRSGNILYVRTSHEMYTSGDGLNHQANVMIAVRIDDMTIVDSLTRVLNVGYGYVSHSFNQFVRVDGTTLLAVDHGDALPRAVVLIKYGEKAGSEAFYGRVSYVKALPIVDSTGHYNDTGVSVGGFECSGTHYLIAGNSADQTEPKDLMYAHRNIFVTATPKDNFTDEATTVTWLTNYAYEDYVEISPPHFIKLDDNRFFLIWKENGVIRYCFVNGKGELDGQIYSGNASLSDCQPILDENLIVWYVTNNSAPTFFRIDLNRLDLGILHNIHSYVSVTTAPTCTEQGYTTHICACGDSYVDTYVNALGHDWGLWKISKEASCDSDGEERMECARCDLFYTRVIKATGHSYKSTVTPPTCGDKGYTTYVCSACADTYVDSYVPATGQHTYTNHKDATCDVCGYERIVKPGIMPVYRLYNPYTYEHLLTSGEQEKTALLAAGWSLDGVAWNAPETGIPVYRLYNPYDDWHTYTTSEQERDTMVAAGWTVDGVVSSGAATEDSRPIYRLFNPYVQTNFHLFTAGEDERDLLISAGWILEGVAWRALK